MNFRLCLSKVSRSVVDLTLDTGLKAGVMTKGWRSLLDAGRATCYRF